jgi:hypothetical protein
VHAQPEDRPLTWAVVARVVPAATVAGAMVVGATVVDAMVADAMVADVTPPGVAAGVVAGRPAKRPPDARPGPAVGAHAVVSLEAHQRRPRLRPEDAIHRDAQRRLQPLHGRPVHAEPKHQRATDMAAGVAAAGAMAATGARTVVGGAMAPAVPARRAIMAGGTPKRAPRARADLAVGEHAVVLLEAHHRCACLRAEDAVHRQPERVLEACDRRAVCADAQDRQRATVGGCHARRLPRSDGCRREQDRDEVPRSDQSTSRRRRGKTRRKLAIRSAL